MRFRGKANGHPYPTPNALQDAFVTQHGRAILGDAEEFLRTVAPSSVDLIITSPPFGLARKKEYGNVDADQYLKWFRPFAYHVYRVLKDTGSLVIDIGGTWNQNIPTRHLYHFKLMIMLCDEYGFHLAQDFYWWNPAKLPTPAEWVAVRRIRVKDSINKIWWLSKTPWPKSCNSRVLHPYSESMDVLLKNGYRANRRPSGHNISKKFDRNNGAAIPSNLLAVSNTKSNTQYLRYCMEQSIKPHHARFSAELPEFLIKMLTDRGDAVIDPFAGSCVTGEVCERLGRKWTCIELREDYLKGAHGRFVVQGEAVVPVQAGQRGVTHYQVPRPGLLWSDMETPEHLPADGGRTFQEQRKRALQAVDDGDSEPQPVAPLAAKPVE